MYDLQHYKSFDLAQQKLTTFEDYMKLLSNLNISREDRCEDGTGHACFGGVYNKTLEHHKDDTYTCVTLDDTVTFEKEVILSYCVYEEDKQVFKQEHTFILDNLEELDKFIKWYDMSNYVVSYQGELYYTLIIGGKDGTYIELEDGTLVKVEEWYARTRLL